jgi:hypothetical protein
MREQSRVAIAICGAVLIIGLAGPATAGSPREHDGFFLRLSAGAGAANTELDIPGAKTELDGGSGDINIAIGGIVARNLAIHGTLFGWLVSDPDVTIEGLGSGTAENTDLDLSAFGGGLTYYFMPVNIYISGSAGAGQLTVDTPAGEADTKNGFVGEITLGKEWWVGGSWGLGVAGAFGFHSIPDKDVDEDWKGTSFAIRFSATLN